MFPLSDLEVETELFRMNSIKKEMIPGLSLASGGMFRFLILSEILDIFVYMMVLVRKYYIDFFA